jgi:F-type H+-transporting ATPase subunit gamma
MTRRRTLEQRRESFGEIRDIMNSMKTLAYLEIRKLGRFLDAQRAVVTHVETVAGDFLGFHPEVLAPVDDTARPVCLLIGSERGFCGDFNEALLECLERSIAERDLDLPLLLVVGRKLATRLTGDTRVAEALDGVSTVAEVETTLRAVIHAVVGLQARHGSLALSVFHHDPDDREVIVTNVLPPFERYRDAAPRYGHAPLTPLPPAAFFGALLDHYLYSVLHEILYVSLMAENLQRVRHLEGAVRHLDEKSSALLRACNALRQEEIIEEIEVILLSTMRQEPSPLAARIDP